jgi:RluA family pseudouridine synthase
MTLDTFEILYQDRHLLAINKPSGLRSIPDGFQPQLEHVRSLLEPQFGRLWIVHRLDKETSGILLLARNSTAHRFLNDQFATRSTKKEYHALITGLPDRDAWEIHLPLRINGDRDHRTVIDLDHGKTAATLIRVLKRFSNGYSLVSASPMTGYTHQIRAHLAACGLPIVGDPLYRAKPHPDIMKDLHIIPTNRIANANRLGLHAFRIQFTHPAELNEMKLSAPYPRDFLALFSQINRK